MAHSIDATTVLERLLSAGCVDPERVDTADVALSDLSSRSTTLGLVVDGQLTSVVKHLNDHASEREREMYEHLGQREALADDIPGHRLIGDDLLVVQAPKGATDLDRHRAKHGLPTWSAAAVGACLARVHDVDVAQPSTIPEAPLPWILRMGNYSAPEWWTMSGAGRQLAQGLTELSRAPEQVRALGESWTPTHLTHCDMKFGNLIIDRSGSSRRSRIRLIDWEIAGVGDPAWDLGCIVGQLLSAWVTSMGVRQDVELADIVTDASFDIHEADQWLRAWWLAYRTTRTCGIDADLIHRMGAYAGVRTIQSGFEYGQHSHRANGLIMSLAQVGANTMQDPIPTLASVLPEFAHAIRTS